MVTGIGISNNRGINHEHCRSMMPVLTVFRYGKSFSLKVYIDLYIDCV